MGNTKIDNRKVRAVCVCFPKITHQPAMTDTPGRGVDATYLEAEDQGRGAPGCEDVVAAPVPNGKVPKPRSPQVPPPSGCYGCSLFLVQSVSL